MIDPFTALFITGVLGSIALSFILWELVAWILSPFRELTGWSTGTVLAAGLWIIIAKKWRASAS